MFEYNILMNETINHCFQQNNSWGNFFRYYILCRFPKLNFTDLKIKKLFDKRL